MKIIQLLKKDTNNSKVDHSILQLNNLVDILNTKNIPENIIEQINSELAELNSSEAGGNDYFKLLKKKQSIITKLLEKEVKLVPKNYYRNLWLVLGMTAFGLPLGVAFGLSIGNMGLLGIGLPIGLFIGMVVGSMMDKKAFENGRQLDIELK